MLGLTLETAKSLLQQMKLDVDDEVYLYDIMEEGKKIKLWESYKIKNRELEANEEQRVKHTCVLPIEID